MKVLRVIAMLLIIIGALNWGLVGFFQFDLVAMIFGAMTMGARVVYGLVGLAGLYGICAFLMRCCGCGCGCKCGGKCGSNCSCSSKKNDLNN